LKTKERVPKGCRFFCPLNSRAYKNRKIPIKRAKRNLVYFSEREEFMQTRREFLTVEELNTLAAMPCERPELKKRRPVLCAHRLAPLRYSKNAVERNTD
jgi:hypothetical protein